MQKLSLALLALVSFAVFSCGDKNKNENVDPPVDPEPTDTAQISKNLLAQTVLTSGSNTTTMTYRYDAQNKLAWFANTSTEAGYFEDTSKIVRDGSGNVTQIIYSSDTSRRFPDPKVDSVVYNVVYDGSKYAYKLADYKMFTTRFKDSSTYTYDAQSRITQENDYYFDFKVTKQYVKWATYDYTYDGAGKLTNWKTTYYDVDASHSDYPFELVFTYEEKGVNVLNLGNEAILLGIASKASAGLPKTMVGTYPKNPEYNQNLTYKYTYNTLYRPLKADITDAANNNAKSTMVFTYQ